MSENYIKEILLGDRNERKEHGARQSEPSVIPLSYPRYKSQKEGCITVICGKNSSGKSHILHNIINAMKKAPYKNTSDSLQYESVDIVVSLSNPGVSIPRKMLLLSDLTSAKKSYENFRLDKMKGDTNGIGIPKLKAALLAFLKSQFEEHTSPPDDKLWNDDNCNSSSSCFVFQGCESSSLYRNIRQGRYGA